MDFDYILFLKPYFLFDKAKLAPFLIASPANKFPSYFFPLIPINIEFLFIFFEFIEAELIKIFLFFKL